MDSYYAKIMKRKGEREKMKYIKPLNITAHKLICKVKPDVYGYACASCCTDYWPGWELGSDGKIDPCPWATDYTACQGCMHENNPPGQKCWWPAQVPDNN